MDQGANTGFVGGLFVLCHQVQALRHWLASLCHTSQSRLQSEVTPLYSFLRALTAKPQIQMPTSEV